MIRNAWRNIVRFLRSAALATWLLVFVGAWSIVATMIPQGLAADPKVSAWAAAYPFFEPAVRVLGFHQAFSSLAFMAGIVALGISTALCAWQRTRIAIGKARTLRRASLADERAVIDVHDLEIACDPTLSEADALSIAVETLGRLGIRTKRRGDLIATVSTPWSVWGSPVFHWALFLLIVALLVGNLQRSEGLMGVAVGETKADEPGSYGLVDSGPWHDWTRVRRSIRVDAFEPHYRTGGIDRGPTPTVTVLDEAGQVIKSQRVYPNMPLQAGSLTIHPSDYGFAVGLTLLNAKGVGTGSSTQLVDFSDSAVGGTAPIGVLNVSDKTGAALLSISVTVPLERTGGQLDRSLPADPAVRVVGTAPGGKKVVDSVIRQGEAIALPTGDSLRLDGIAYYARLSVVDDWSIPLLYAGLVIAMLGLTITVVARQQIVLATVVESGSGVMLAVRVRLWRNAPTSRSEIESELIQALTGVEKGSTT